MGGPVLGHWWHSGGMSLAVPSLPPPGKSSVFLFLQEKKSNNERQSQKAARDESKDLAGCLQHSLQHIAELERALSAVTATQEKKEISVCTLEKEKKHDTRWVEKLERSLSKLKNQRESRGPYCLLPFSAEPLPLEPPAVPSEVELQHLRKEVERMAGELQAQVDDNQRMSVLIWGQKERLQEQEERFREQEERLREQEERLQEQEERLREQEERLWEQDERIQQLAEPQSGFEELAPVSQSAALEAVERGDDFSHLPPPFPVPWEADTKFLVLQLQWVAADCFSLSRTVRTRAHCSWSTRSFWKLLASRSNPYRLS
ncbi:PREDICTED: golgin subfamily A member 8C-like isoform X4 [Cercocebus atys]|uniref:golgin subfamily A member 8C-like isoform X4 n=1 Tax=Cercocebus atys TaxID=9531 RepID=UPI0005F44875|nr:PREDICTED: golgin subfamily A member 8C-like isoform X4 [Cercocebus atys]